MWLHVFAVLPDICKIGKHHIYGLNANTVIKQELY